MADEIEEKNVGAKQETGAEELTVTFDDGVTLTLSQYDEYIGRQLEWLESLPPITPEDGELYDYWMKLHHECDEDNHRCEGVSFDEASLSHGKDAASAVEGEIGSDGAQTSEKGL